MEINVLIVEDDPAHRHIMRGALESLGWKADTAASAAEGYEKATAMKPKLVVTDIHLPDGDGFELCRRLRGRADLKFTPILMVTGTYHKDEDKLRATDAGADAYMLKPLHLPEFLRMAKRLVGVES